MHSDISEMTQQIFKVTAVRFHTVHANVLPTDQQRRRWSAAHQTTQQSDARAVYRIYHSSRKITDTCNDSGT